MDGLKVLGKIIAIIGVHIGVSILLFFFVFSRFFATPDYILEIAESSGIYSAAADEIVRATAKEQPATVSGVSVSQEEYEEALSAVITPDFVQTQIGTTVNGFYEWLEGETEEPSFTLTAENERRSLADVFSKLAVQKLEELPTCTSTEQLQASINAQSLTCTPPDFDATETQEAIRQELLDSADFFGDTELSSEELLQGEGEFDSSRAPRDFERAKIAWVHAGIIFGASVGALALLTGSKRKAIHITGIQLIVVGVGVAFLGAAGLIINALVETSSNLTDIQLAGVTMLKDFTTALSQLLLTFAAVSIVLGIVGFLASRPQEQQADDVTAPIR